MASFMASYIDVSFKKDGVEVYKASASLGCVRQGPPHDAYDCIRQGLSQMKRAVESGAADVLAHGYNSVTVGGGEHFSRADLVKAGIVEAPKKTVCFPKPKPRKP